MAGCNRRCRSQDDWPQQVVPGRPNGGREQLSGFEGKPILAQITQIEAHGAPGGRIGHEAKRSVPCPGSLKTPMAPGIGGPVHDQGLPLISRRVACITT